MMRTTHRRTILAFGLALGAAMLATPVAAADDQFTDPVDVSGRASFVLPVLEEHDALVDRAQLMRATGDLHWSELLLDPDGLHLVTHEGLTPAGVEWTRTIASHASGVEWTRLRASDPEGSSWTETSMTDASGVEWTFMTFERADGAAWVESRFVDGDGRAWSRGAPGNDLDGVEWT
ncbi:MAG: hypothetical protein M3452_05675 [Chloroflexota bacterium]|nr:hypothetical protein [Chloroflexota bacterium]